jgi:hypothetical protein
MAWFEGLRGMRSTSEGLAASLAASLAISTRPGPRKRRGLTIQITANPIQLTFIHRITIIIRPKRSPICKSPVIRLIRLTVPGPLILKYPTAQDPPTLLSIFVIKIGLLINTTSFVLRDNKTWDTLVTPPSLTIKQ